jgi:hypothetical protein
MPSMYFRKNAIKSLPLDRFFVSLGIRESELQRIWPLNEKNRKAKIAQFAKDTDSI